MKLILKQPCKDWGVNQPFGANFSDLYTSMGMLGHNGIDLWAMDSTPVYATHDGRVTFTGYDGAGGLGVVIRTEQEFESLEGVSSYWKTIYWHLKKDTIKVTGSQTVKCGDLIALADNTGRSTGSHLHFGLKPIQKGENDWDWFNLNDKNGYMGSVDPMPYFDRPRHIFTQVLRLGSKGNEVKELQKILDIKQDGDFGKITQARVKDFQQMNMLVPDGIVGKLTNKALNNI